MILNFGKRKSIEITNADEITDLLANKLHAKNDEVMSLTQEVDKLGQEINELNRSREFKTNVIQEYAERIIELEEEKKQLIESNKLANRVTDRLENQNEELRLKQHTPAKHKQEISKYKNQIENLTKEVDRFARLYEANSDYRETYEYISNPKNRKEVTQTFCHNFNVWLKDKTVTNVEAAQILQVEQSLVTDFKNYRVGPTVNNIQKVDLMLCDYFNCSVYELVSVKMEGKK